MEKMAGKESLQPTAPITFLVQTTKNSPSNFVKMKYHCCLVVLFFWGRVGGGCYLNRMFMEHFWIAIAHCGMIASYCRAVWDVPVHWCTGYIHCYAVRDHSKHQAQLPVPTLQTLALTSAEGHEAWCKATNEYVTIPRNRNTLHSSIFLHMSKRNINFNVVTLFQVCNSYGDNAASAIMVSTASKPTQQQNSFNSTKKPWENASFTEITSLLSRRNPYLALTFQRLLLNN